MLTEEKINEILDEIEKVWNIHIEYLWNEDCNKYYTSFFNNPTLDQYFNTLTEFVIFLNGFLTALNLINHR